MPESGGSTSGEGGHDTRAWVCAPRWARGSATPAAGRPSPAGPEPRCHQAPVTVAKPYRAPHDLPQSEETLLLPVRSSEIRSLGGAGRRGAAGAANRSLVL